VWLAHFDIAELILENDGWVADAAVDAVELRVELLERQVVWRQFRLVAHQNLDLILFQKVGHVAHNLVLIRRGLTWYGLLEHALHLALVLLRL
jgi:hypothetical protein